GGRGWSCPPRRHADWWTRKATPGVRTTAPGGGREAGNLARGDPQWKAAGGARPPRRMDRPMRKARDLAAISCQFTLGGAFRRGSLQSGAAAGRPPAWAGATPPAALSRQPAG